MSVSSFQSLLHRFFTDRLLKQLGASQYTVAAYRDAFRLLLQFASEHLGRAPSELVMENLDVAFLGQFLEHLELDRGNCIRTRNNRLSAIHAFFQYVAISEPALALQCQRVLAIPSKRYERRPVEFLTEEETSALLAAPDTATWVGRRDRALLLLAVQTGLRNSEITSLKRQDVELGTGAHVRCLGKGRKLRCTPMRPDVAAVLKEWMLQQGGEPEDPVFPRIRGGRLSRDAVEYLLAKYANLAARSCPSLQQKKVTPHVCRHA